MEVQKKKVSRNSLIDYIFYLTIGVILGNLLSNIIGIGVVSGQSMEPTYYNGGIMIMNKLDKPNNGDIVVFDYNGKALIKRVIGVPGDILRKDSNGIYVNGKLLDESYLEDSVFEGGILENNTIVLKEDEYFVMGDNRKVSLDSRRIGVVKEEDIIGVKVINIFKG